MLQSIWEDAKREFSYGNMVTRIIIINVAVFVLINIINLALYIGNGFTPSPFFDDFLHFFCMAADWKYFLTHPWGIFTSMFLHESFWHIIWNMLFLYWFGRIVSDFVGNQRILPIYVLGGLVGALFYFMSANLLQYPASFALGASAGVMAIVVAAGVIAPDYIMRLLFIGDVKLKYIVGVLIFLDLILLPKDGNTGGHFAHLGGALFGWFYVKQLQTGSDWAVPVNQFFDAVSSFFNRLFQGRQKGPKVIYRNPDRNKTSSGGMRSRSSRSRHNRPHHKTDQSHQERVDEILDKIKKSGYDSLSSEEKEFLFNASKK